MNAVRPRRVSLIIAGGLPSLPSPTIGATTGGCPAVRRLGSRLSPALQASPLARRLARPRRPNRVHVGRPAGRPVLRTGRSRCVALHLVLPRRSYASIPHGSSPHGSGLSPLCPLAFSGARAHAPTRAAVDALVHRTRARHRARFTAHWRALLRRRGETNSPARLNKAQFAEARHPTTMSKEFVFLPRFRPRENARNTRRNVPVSALFVFFCGCHLWMRRQPRSVHPWLNCSF